MEKLRKNNSSIDEINWVSKSRLAPGKTGFFNFYAMEKINVANKFSQFSKHYNPKITGDLHGQMVKLVKFKGPFVWHHHDNEDEMFYVVKGSFDMELEDKIITINEGEFIIIPRGVEHRPNAKEEVQVMLFEPGTTLNRGNVRNELTQE